MVSCQGSQHGVSPPAARPKSKHWTRALLALLGTVLGLGIVEIGARVFLSHEGGPFAHNPVIRKQADNVGLFEPDELLGHRLKGGKFIATHGDGLITAHDIANDPKRAGKLLVLNLGDSSTSGWDSNVVVGNGRRHANGETMVSPFQTYKTYSAILSESDWVYSVNAGVPGFSAVQGARYLRRLLREFSRLGVSVDVVTVYFGNNDSAWNGNVEDSYTLRGEGFRFHLWRLLNQATNSFRAVTRVPPGDYAAYLKQIVTVGRQAGVDVVLIEPVVPLHWWPGRRAEGLEDEEREQQSTLAGTEVLRHLLASRELFRQGEEQLKAGNADAAGQLFEQASEADYVVPRIKQAHREALRAVAREEGVPLVYVGDKIPPNRAGYFLDYCHPIEPANRLIAEDLIKVLKELSWARRRR